jgi:transcription elongation GreA/GreB family factor
VHKGKHYLFPAVVTDRELRSVLRAARAAEGAEQPYANWLEQRLRTARVIPFDTAPSGVIALNRRARITSLASGTEREVKVVLGPSDTAGGTRPVENVSLFSPLGAALYGRYAGSLAVPVGEAGLAAVRVLTVTADTKDHQPFRPGTVFAFHTKADHGDARDGYTASGTASL